MPRDPRYDILFEPVKIGPKIARNRFYQVPHCNGMGRLYPSANATMRGIKAEGGWAVVCTEETDIHPSSDVSPANELRLWSDEDIPVHERIVAAIHAHGGLAGLEPCHNGFASANNSSREVPLAPQHMAARTGFSEPLQARALDKQDLRDIRRWHRLAARRGKQAGYDLIYVYAGHGLTTAQHLLSRYTNQRTDEYGGSLENRVRFLRELIADTREEIGDVCAVPVRIAVDELVGERGITAAEMHDVVGLLAELPDLWDFCLGNWPQDSASSRFAEEGFQEHYVRGLKKLTTRPVVGVGRFTSPDAMVRQVSTGILDMVGAARPSIADPFLPRKIEEGRIEDIRECIGCNMCVAGDYTMTPSRCTQNATFGDEWRRGWHPERFARAGSGGKVLVVGAGPAGLEAARVAAMRGYEVALAEGTQELGGRVARERQLPGLAAWGRVADYRTYQLSQRGNVEIYRGSALGADDILDFGFAHVAIATGAKWRRDGVARHHLAPIPIATGARVLTPDDVMSGKLPEGRVAVYDDDHYYMAGVLAELLALRGCKVSLITPATMVSAFTKYTLEQPFIQERLLRLGVRPVLGHALARVADDHVEARCIYTGKPTAAEAGAVVLVTARLPCEDVWLELERRRDDWAAAGIRSAQAIGDCHAPATIAHAVYAGHRFGRGLDEAERGDELPFRRELPQLSPSFPARFP